MVTAVISAGGYGVRCDSLLPKALLKLGDITYLELLMTELAKAGVKKSIIYCNRPAYINNIRTISEKIMITNVLLDQGVNSTFELAKDSSYLVSSPNIIFCYGHAPRPARYLRFLMKGSEIPVASTLSSSTKQLLVSNRFGKYLEPPYLLSVLSLQRSRSNNWKSYLMEEIQSLSYTHIQGPNEFNYMAERHGYNEYIESWFRNC